MKKTVTISVFLFLALSSCKRTRYVNWYPYYESQILEPFGTYVFREELNEILPNTSVQDITVRTMDYFRFTEEFSYSTYLYINKHNYLSESTLELLEFYALAGNSVFISSESIELFYRFDLDIREEDGREFRCKLTNLQGNSKTFRIMPKTGTVRFFTSVPKNADVLSTVYINGKWRPFLIAYNTNNNRGRRYFQCNPEFYTNYSMLNAGSGSYALNSMSHLVHDNYLIWDGYGTERRYTRQYQQGSNRSAFDYIKRNKALYMAFLVSFLSILAFFLFNHKRKTRVMPVYTIPQNNSIEFMTMISNLFKTEDNHIDLARHRANFVLDRMKSRYHLDTSELNDSFLQRLSEKTKVAVVELQPFIRLLNEIRNTGYLSRKDFMKFNQTIESYTVKLDLYHGTNRIRR